MNSPQFKDRYNICINCNFKMSISLAVVPAANIYSESFVLSSKTVLQYVKSIRKTKLLIDIITFHSCFPFDQQMSKMRREKVVRTIMSVPTDSRQKSGFIFLLILNPQYLVLLHFFSLK